MLSVWSKVEGGVGGDDGGVVVLARAGRGDDGAAAESVRFGGGAASPRELRVRFRTPERVFDEMAAAVESRELEGVSTARRGMASASSSHSSGNAIVTGRV